MPDLTLCADSKICNNKGCTRNPYNYQNKSQRQSYASLMNTEYCPLSKKKRTVKNEK